MVGYLLHFGAAGHVNGPIIDRRDPSLIQSLRNGDRFKRTVDAQLMSKLGQFWKRFVRWNLSDTRCLPHQMHTVLRNRVVNTVALGERRRRCFAPAFRQKIVVKFRVATHDPQLPSRALDVAPNIRHAHNFHRMQVRRQGHLDEPIAHAVQIGVTPLGGHESLVFGRSQQKLVVDHGIPTLFYERRDQLDSVTHRALTSFELANVLFIENDVGRFHVGNGVALGLQISNGSVRDGHDGICQCLVLEAPIAKRLDQVFSGNPPVDQLVLSQNIQIDSWVTGGNLVQLVQRPPGLPHLQSFWRHVDAKGLLRTYRDFTRSKITRPELRYQRELFPRAIEFGVQKVFECVRRKRYILTDTAILDDEVELSSLDLFGWYPVHGTRAFQATSISSKPTGFIPVLDLKQFKVRDSEWRQI